MKSKTPLAQALAFDRNRWLPVEASRSAVGVALTVVVSALAGNPGAGALAALGALYTGLAATTGVYHARIRAMTGSGLMIGLATTLGALVAHSPIASILAVLAIAFITSLYSSSSRLAGTIAAQSTAILCVVIGLQLPAQTAFNDGLLVLGGAAVQLFLLTVVWPMKPGIPERAAVADAFDALARFVSALPSTRAVDSPKIPAATQIQEARLLLSEAERLHWQPEHDALFEALRRAEAIRAALVGFARADRVFASLDRASRIRADRVLRSISRSLKEVGARARAGSLYGDPVTLRNRSLAGDSEAEAEYSKWVHMLSDLIGDCCGPPRASYNHNPPKGLKTVFSTLTKLPDIRSIRSVALQHALRYAVTVEAAFVISQHWTRSHAYWLPVTVAVVLRQDYGSTIQRAVSRLAGTLVGLAFADAALSLLHPSPFALQAMALATTWLAFASIQASYAVATVAITGFVVFSIAASGIAAGEVSAMRFVASAFGVLMAVTSYALWPAWHWSQIWETLKMASESQSAYCELVLEAHTAHLAGAGDSEPTRTEVDEARSAARALRIQSENLVEAAKVHPRGRDRRLLRIAEDASQVLEENAATILVAQSAWNIEDPEKDEQLHSALKSSQSLTTQLAEIIR